MHPSRYWHDFATRAYPNLGWALSEIPIMSTLDETCVELELATGVPAYRTRNELLLRESELYAMTLFELIVSDLARKDARLTGWCLLAVIEDGDSIYGPETGELADAIEVCRDWFLGGPRREELLDAWRDLNRMSLYDRRDSYGNLLYSLTYVFRLFTTNQEYVDVDNALRSYAAIMTYAARRDMALWDRFKKVFLDAFLTYPVQP